MERIPDEVLLEMAAADRRILVTHNIKDFARIVHQRPPEKTHSGLMLIPRSIRPNDFGALISVIHGTISNLSDEEWIDRVEWMRRVQSR